jgi:hypothetical protein
MCALVSTLDSQALIPAWAGREKGEGIKRVQGEGRRGTGVK